MSHTSLDGAPPSTGQDHFLRLRGLKFHYVSWGRADAPVVLCLHGLRSYARTFEPLALALSDTFHVLALDLRGRGQTDWDPAGNYYIDEYVADLERFVEALGLARFHLLGHSLGGIIAYAYSHLQAERLQSLVIEDSGPNASRHGPGAGRINAELRSTPATFPDWQSAKAFWRSIRPNVTEAAIQSRMANSLRQTDAGVSWIHDQVGIANCRLSPARPEPDLWPCVKALSCPTLLLRGGSSDYLSRATVDEMVASNPLIEAQEIPGAGHYIHDDQPVLFIAAVRPFLFRLAR
jgi:pimeloyl-ACP methyl ester carboxylesterase